MDFSVVRDRSRRKNKYRKAIVGTVETLANEASALKAAQALRIDANQQTPQAEAGPGTVAALVAHYRLKELAGDAAEGRHSRHALRTSATWTTGFFRVGASTS